MPWLFMKQLKRLSSLFPTEKFWTHCSSHTWKSLTRSTCGSQFNILAMPKTGEARWTLSSVFSSSKGSPGIQNRIDFQERRTSNWACPQRRSSSHSQLSFQLGKKVESSQVSFLTCRLFVWESVVSARWQIWTCVKASVPTFSTLLTELSDLDKYNEKR